MIRILDRVAGILVRIVGVGVRIAIFVLLLAVLASAAATFGVIDVGPGDGGTVDTPDPLPDWPFVWDVPADEEPDVETDPHPESADGGEFGDPVREDPGTTSVELDGATVPSDEIETRVHERVNDVRADHDLSELERDEEIASIARTHSHDMAERGYFSHVSPEGETPADRFGDLYPNECRAVGENLALVGVAGTGSADEIAERVVDGWMASEGHRENILTARWDSQGIGVYVDGDRVYATQKFCD